MNRAHCLCERCAREGLAVPATEAHHVIPVETAIDYAGKERLMYDASNVQCLCHRCHLEAHKELGKGGKAGNRKRQEEKLQEFKRRFLGE